MPPVIEELVLLSSVSVAGVAEVSPIVGKKSATRLSLGNAMVGISDAAVEDFLVSSALIVSIASLKARSSLTGISSSSCRSVKSVM